MIRCLLRLRILVLAGLFWAMTLHAESTSPPGVLPPASPPAKVLPPMNMIVQISRDLASAAAYRTRVNPEIVDEVINEAKVDGTGTSYSIVGVEFLPDDKQASVELVIHSKLLTDTTGVKGPVTTFNSAVHCIEARKPVQITIDGLTTQYAYVSVQTDITLHGMATKFRGVTDSLVKQIATRIYDRDYDKSRSETEFKTGRKTINKVDEEVGEELQKGQKNFMEKLRRPLEKNKILADPFLFRTNHEVLTAIGRLADEKNPPVIHPAPAVEGAPALAVRVHESLLNTGADRLFAGKTFRDTDVQKQLEELGIPLPQTAKKEAEPAKDKTDKKEEEPEKDKKDKKDKKKEFEVTFAKEEAIRVAFEKNTLRVTLRVTNLKTDLSPDAEPEVFTNRWEISALYRLLRTEKGGIRLEREGDLKSIPLGDDEKPRTGKLSGPQIIERRRLNAILKEELFKETQEVDEVKPTGDLAKIGTLRTTQVGSSDGWLVVAWKRVPKPE